MSDGMDYEMIEIEIKLPLSNAAETEKRLIEMGFTPTETVCETDIYFNSSAHDFRKTDEALRIRTIKDIVTNEMHSVITYKGPKLDLVSMTRTELETEVADAEVCRRMFISLGYDKQYRVCKNRRSLQKNGMTACIDRVEDLGNFMELEMMAEDLTTKDVCLEQMEQVLRQAGLSMADTTRTSYLTMLQQKGIV